MSVLGKARIEALLKEARLKDRLIITPLLSIEQIQSASVDIRLGHDFTTTRKGNLPYIDASESNFEPHRHQSRHYVNRSERFFLHPHELVLASTLEYLRLPTTVSGWVTSRSSWGRAGLVIATATAVHPGFTGAITLELLNLGEVPLVLYPGLSVAQLILVDAEGASDYTGHFNFQIDAHHADVVKHKQADHAFWRPQEPAL
jgi:dCTP deaminase